MNITATDLDLSFALSHAINLAEVATSVQDKRIGASDFLDECAFITLYIGYLFCVEIMPVQHSLQLLLVNTLRKVVGFFPYSAMIFMKNPGPRKLLDLTDLFGFRHYDPVALCRSHTCSTGSPL
jgi:hypothetical protein